MNENTSGGLTRLDFGDPANAARLHHLFRYAQVGRCVNGVAHDINNHLGAAMAYAELALMDEEIAAETQEQIDKIISAIDKCGKLVGTLTGVARPLTANANMIDLNGLVRGVLLLRDYAFRLAKIEIATDFAPDLPSPMADGPRLQLAMLYIFMNIEEHCAETKAGTKIALRTYRDGSDLVVAIKHDGAAIPDRVCAAMFDAYTTSKADCNTGLGLAQARAMLVEQNGSLDYDPDGGFLLRIPVSVM